MDTGRPFPLRNWLLALALLSAFALPTGLRAGAGAPAATTASHVPCVALGSVSRTGEFVARSPAHLPSHWLHKDPGSPEARLELMAFLEAGLPPDDSRIEARRALLAPAEIIAFSRGGMGFTFALREAGGRIRRYKGVSDPDAIRDAEKHATSLNRLREEAKLARIAGDAGLGPKTSWNEEAHLVSMENIEGRTLDEFIAEELPRMSVGQREEWISRFLVNLADRVTKLHALGIAHLDLKPSNLMISKSAPDESSLLLIDFGLAVFSTGFDNPERRIRGTPEFMGPRARRGELGFDNDAYSLAITARKLFHGRTGPWSDPYFASRPELAALLALLEHAPQKEKPHDDLARLMRLAVEHGPHYDRAVFWKQWRRALANRTAADRNAVRDTVRERSQRDANDG